MATFGDTTGHGGPEDPEQYAYLPIEDYGIIGDLHTAALVGRNGSIDWCCFPRFDSPALFAAILDRRKGGRFQICATAKGTRRQMYHPDTNVLITRFLSPEGVGEVVDFMPVEEQNVAGPADYHQIVREARCVRGQATFQLLCEPAFDFGRARHKLHLHPGGAIFAGPGMAVGLVSPAPLERTAKGGVTARFTLKAGQRSTFIFRQAERAEDRTVLRAPTEAESLTGPTLDFWRRWLHRCHYRGRWRETVNRSALTLKLLTFRPTGAVVAAPTASLPERIGGGRNWDYRYTWLRDASFTVYALMRIGFVEEAAAFMGWLEARCRQAGKKRGLRIMYGIEGQDRIEEQVLDHLEGYRGSAPVRIGNAAYKQFQLDIYGELMDAINLYDRFGRPISHDLWEDARKFLDWTVRDWRKRDDGIWEVRGGRQHFTYSKLMCWVALDRGLRLARRRGLPGAPATWERNRDQLYRRIMGPGWNAKVGAFAQSLGGKELDASLLRMPLVDFTSPLDPRMLSTLDAILRDLTADSLVYRYRPQSGVDGLAGAEGTFSMCSFWLVECLTRAGRLEQARFVFEKMLSYGNHLGLFSEEIGPGGEALGNFPQAFTHLALISAAVNLDKALDS